MRKPYICGNWKMNLDISDLGVYFNALNHEVANLTDKVDVGIAPAFTLLSPAREFCGAVTISAQNVNENDSGAYTGEISLGMLKSVGVQSVIIGHSERRQYYGETNASVGTKIEKALASGFMVIACIGETKEQRESGETESVVAAQLAPIFTAAKTRPENIVLAYEPVWAIGTGLTATPKQAQDVHAFIRQEASQALGENFAKQVRIQYGGSVKPSNAKELLSQEDIDGALVGGASLKPSDFAAIVKAAI